MNTPNEVLKFRPDPEDNTTREHALSTWLFVIAPSNDD